MYQLGNNILGTLKADITGGAVSLVMQPMPGTTAFALGPDPTNAGAGTPTYGAPYGVLTLIDRLDSSAAKIEHVLYTSRAVEAGGAYTYSGLVRGWDGSSAQAWTLGAYIIQQPIADVLGMHMQRAVLRAGFMLVHDRDSAMTWDGTSFKFNTFQAQAIGRGKHWSSQGYYQITLPPNGTTVKGYGGASDYVVAGGVIVIPDSTAFYYEPNIAGGFATVNANFRLVYYNSDFVVPPHWIFLALHAQVVSVGEKILRVANGATLYPWQAPSFAGAWVNFGAPLYDAGFQKGPDQLVRLRGGAKSGTIGTTIFTLPAGYRPANRMHFAVASNAAYGQIQISSDGTVVAAVGSNTDIRLDGIAFKAEA